MSITTEQRQALLDRLAAAFDDYQTCDEDHDQRRRDFVFHMTDWLDDQQRLAALYADPEQFGTVESGDIVFGFLAHALWHLNEAYHLLNGHTVPNPFRESDADSAG
jgi:hypothetical protein